VRFSGTPEHLSAFIAKMETEGLAPIVIDTFAYYYDKIVAGETGLIYDQDIHSIGADEIEGAENLISYTDAGKRVLKNSVKIILNGGLGTTMGLTRAKSLVEVRPGKSFLEIILHQTLQRGIKLAFMNSFSTHEDTLAALARIDPAVKPLVFLQHKFPKILRDGLRPAVWPENPNLEWNPPGHGDVYTALFTSGVLQSLLDDGIQYALIANSDNLGATVDPSLL